MARGPVSTHMAGGSTHMAGGSTHMAGGSTHMAGGSTHMAGGSTHMAGGSTHMAGGSTRMAGVAAYSPHLPPKHAFHIAHGMYMWFPLMIYYKKVQYTICTESEDI